MTKRVLNNRGPRKDDLQAPAKKPPTFSMADARAIHAAQDQRVEGMLDSFRVLEQERRRRAHGEQLRMYAAAAEQLAGIPVVVIDSMPPARMMPINPTQPGGRVLRPAPDQIVQIKTDSFDDET